MRLRFALPPSTVLPASSSTADPFRLSLPHPPHPRTIVHVIGSVHPNAGGPSTVVTRLAAAQAALGHDVTILSFLPPAGRPVFEQAVATIPGFDRVRLILKPIAKANLWLLHPNHRRQITEALESADVLHLHGVWEPLLLLAARAAHAAGVPYVLRPCGMLHPWSLRQSKLKKRIALAAGVRWMLNHAACLHVLNDDENRLVKRLGLSCPTHVLSNGVFLEEIHPLPAPGSFHNAHPELHNKPYILFLSRLHQKKGLDYLVDAFNTVAESDADVQLVIAGPDAGELHTLNVAIAASPAAARIHVVGALHGTQKLAAFADASAFCLPSRQEGFSLATCEALAAGTPVVISHATHFPEVADVNAGRIVPLDASAIAAALLEILHNPFLRAAMSHAGRQLMEDAFTWQAIASRCDTLYTRATTTRAAKLNIWPSTPIHQALPA